MVNKKYLSIALAVLILVVLVGWFFYYQQKGQGYKKVLSDNEALLVLNEGSRQERWFKGEVIQGMTVYDVLITSARAGGFDVNTNWRCRVNNKEIQGDLSQTTIQPKDKISCTKY